MGSVCCLTLLQCFLCLFVRVCVRVRCATVFLMHRISQRAAKNWPRHAATTRATNNHFLWEGLSCTLDRYTNTYVSQLLHDTYYSLWLCVFVYRCAFSFLCVFVWYIPARICMRICVCFSRMGAWVLLHLVSKHTTCYFVFSLGVPDYCFTLCCSISVLCLWGRIVFWVLCCVSCSYFPIEFAN